MVKIKICGITCEKEIEYLNTLKPDYIGFVFAKSKRQISKMKAKNLIEKLDDEIKCVGVFKDNSIDEITDILKSVKLDIIQLHGNEGFEFVNKLRKCTYSTPEIWKALSISNETLLTDYISCYLGINKSTLIDNILIDGSNPGSGKTYSLLPLKKLLKNYNCKFNFILAGGITPENVLEKIEEITPWGVDVSSGVEEMNDNNIRMKSFEKMKKLIQNIREIQV